MNAKKVLSDTNNKKQNQIIRHITYSFAIFFVPLRTEIKTI